MIPVRLGQNAARFGLAEALAQPQQQQRRVVGDDPKRQQYGDSARAYGLAEALQPIEVSSGTWGEAIAEALAGGLRGRAAQSERQGQVDQEQWDTNREQKIEGARNSAITQALSGFDPSNPQALVGALSQGAPEEALSLAGALAGRGPQAQYGDLERIDGRLGQRNQATGQYDWAPQVPGAAYQPPAGYRGSPETGLEPIPGGPADLRATQQGQQRRDMLDSSSRNLEQAIASITRAEGMVNGFSTGAAGQVFRGIGGTDAYDLQQSLEPVRAILSFENLAEMRRNSATGGALGSIAVRELDLLGSTVASLDTAQSEQEVRNALRIVRQQLTRTLQAVQAARQEMETGPSEAPMEPNMAGERVMQYNPATGRVE